MRVLRWTINALGQILVYVLRASWEAFNSLKPSSRLWTIAVIATLAWLYFRSQLWVRTTDWFYADVFEPTGDIVYAIFKVLFVISLVAICGWLTYGFLQYKRPQNIEDIETSSAVHEVVPLWQRLINSRKRQGGDE